MRVLTLTDDVNAKNLANADSFFGNRNVHEFDAVLVDFGRVAPHLLGRVAHSERRLRELANFVDSGKSVVVPISRVGVGVTEERFAALQCDCPPLKDALNTLAFRQTPRRGELVSASPELPAEAKTVAEKLARSLHYESILFGQNTLHPVFRESATEGIVGLYGTAGKGCVLLLPPLQADLESRLNARALQSTMNELVFGLAEALKVKDIAGPIPTWANRFLTEKEALLHEEIGQKTERIKQLGEKVKSIESGLRAEEMWKHLFTCSGQPLEAAVQRCFDEIGIRIAPGPQGRADFVANLNGTPAVLEVKGKKAGVTVPIIRQLAQWVHEGATALAPDEDDEVDEATSAYRKAYEGVGIAIPQGSGEVEPKGILILNHDWNEPLDARAPLEVPNTAKSVVERYNVSIVTGVQLFSILQAVRDGQLKVVDVHKLLLEGNGVIDLPQSWETVLTARPEE